MYAVVGVAHDAAGQALILKHLAVRALCVHLGLENVAVGANVLHLVYAWRCGTVIAVARGAGGRAQVAAHGEGVVMNAGGVVGKLIGGNAVRLHVSRVGVAARAGLGHVDRIHR